MVIVVGMGAASRPSDRKHPYGHARMEAITALVVAILLFVGGASHAAMSTSLKDKAIALARDALSVSYQLFKVMVPVLIAVKILKELGLIRYLAIPLEPVMARVGLPRRDGSGLGHGAPQQHLQLHHRAALPWWTTPL